MGKDKLRKFKENETFRCLVQPATSEVLNCDHPLKGKWGRDFFGNDNPIILELGCGTGKVTRRLKACGYDMIGIDISEEMLEMAQNQEHDGILYLHQDMREFELFGTVAAVVSLCDSMNYITSEEDLLKVFRLVNNYLDPEGIFVFDFNKNRYYSN